MTICKQLVRQTSAEGWISRKLALAHVVALDRAVINGSGVEGQPNLVIGEWGLIEIVVDPYKLTQGMIEVTSFQIADLALQTPSAFGVIADAKTS
jgi:hypothetical protein